MKTLKIDRKKIEKYNRILETQELGDECLCDDCLMCWTVRFDDGVEADLIISREGNAVFIEVKWYNDCNEELDHSELGYKLDSEWIEKIDGKDYSFNVVAE